MLFARFFRNRKGGCSLLALGGYRELEQCQAAGRAGTRRHRINVVERKMTALKTASPLVVDRRAPADHLQQRQRLYTVRVNASGDRTPPC
jgi:hypothetical protein